MFQLQATSIRELVKIRDRLEICAKTAQRDVNFYGTIPVNQTELSRLDTALRQRAINDVVKYDAMIKQLQAVIDFELSK